MSFVGMRSVDLGHLGVGMIVPADSKSIIISKEGFFSRVVCSCDCSFNFVAPISWDSYIKMLISSLNMLKYFENVKLYREQ